MPALEVTSAAGGRQLIGGYGGGGFKVGGQRFAGSIIVTPRRTLPWAASQPDQILCEALAAVFAAEKAQLLLIGCGKWFLPAPAPLIRDLTTAGIAFEWMDTGAACRTFNVLLLEERDVAAALLAVE